MIGLKVRKIALLVGMVLGLASFFAGYVWKENNYIQLVRKEKISEAAVSKITDEIVRIQLDNKKLKDFNRLEKIGVEKFAFIYEGVPNLVYPEKKVP